MHAVQAVRGSERSDRDALFVPGLRPVGRRRALRELGELVGGTVWWTYFSEMAHSEPASANVFRLREALAGGDAAPAGFVRTVLGTIDATAYGATTDERRATARALGDVDRRFLWQAPDALLGRHLACSAYPGSLERFRLLPADVQLRILNTATPDSRSCFAGSAYHQESRDALRASGVGAAALATLGF